MTTTREQKVKEFRDAAEQKAYIDDPDATDLIFKCIYEEFIEFNDAVYLYEEAIDNGMVDFDPVTVKELRANLVKEWADLQYCVSQAAVFFDIPAEEAFDRVHTSNMSKVVEGKVRRREDGKILKPDDYVAPDMKGL